MRKRSRRRLPDLVVVQVGSCASVGVDACSRGAAVVGGFLGERAPSWLVDRPAARGVVLASRTTQDSGCPAVQDVGPRSEWLVSSAFSSISVAANGIPSGS